MVPLLKIRLPNREIIEISEDARNIFKELFKGNLPLNRKLDEVESLSPINDALNWLINNNQESIRAEIKLGLKVGTKKTFEIMVVMLKEHSLAIVTFHELKNYEKIISKLESKARFLKNLMDNLPGVAYRCRNDRKWTSEFLSSGIRALTGYGRSELLFNRKISFDSIIIPEDREHVWEQVQKALAKKKPFELMYRIKTKDGSVRWLWEQGRGVFKEDGSVEALEGILLDITAYKELELTLSREKSQLRTLIDNLPDLIYFKDRESRFLLCNRATAEFMGVGSPEELIGKTDFDFYPEKTANLFYTDEQNIVKTGKPILNKEEYFKSANGEYVWLSTSKIPIFDGEGNVTGIVGIGRNITEIKEMEKELSRKSKELQLIFDTVPAMIFYKDRSGKFIKVNRAFAEYYGVDPEEIEGKSSFEISPRYAHRYYEDDQEVIRTGKPKFGIIEAKESIKGMRWVETHKVPYRDRDGNIIGVIGFSFDITDRKELEERLNQAQRLESIGRLSAGIAHEFNNLLTVINGYTQLLMAQISRESSIYKYIEEIERAGQRAAVITNQLLGFSRKQIFRPVTLEISKVTGEELAIMKNLLPKNIHIECRFSDDELYFNCDRTHFQQIFTNLVKNAVDAMGDGGKITLITDKIEIGNSGFYGISSIKEGTYVMLKVEDNGIGMDEVTLSKIFDPFFTTKEVGKGTGLGLSVVYGLVKQNNGYIFAESKPGEGSTFTIIFPVVEEGLRSERSSYFEKGLLEKSGDSRGILVVEDEDFVRKLLIETLTYGGYRVFSASRVNDAIDIFLDKKRSIDLLIVDMVMPGLSGKELAENLCNIKKDLKVVLISGYPEELISELENSKGRFHFIKKPFDSEGLLKKIGEILEK